MPGMTIDLKATGIVQAAGALGVVAVRYQQIALAQRQLNAGIAAMPRLNAGGGGAQSLTVIQQNTTAIQSLTVVLQQAVASGIRGGGTRTPRTQAGFMERLSKAVLSTRFNVGGQGFGVSPLVGRTLGVAGLKGGGAAGVALVISAAVLAYEAATWAVKTFAQVVRTAADEIHGASSARTVSGGSSGQIAGLQAMGISAAMIPGLAASLRSKLSTDGLAMGFGAKVGVGPRIGGPLGNTNEAGDLQQAMLGIAGLSKAEDRLRAARALELEAILPQIEAVRRNRAAIAGDAKARNAIADPGTLKAADDFTSAIGRFQFNLMSIVQALGKPFLRDGAAALNVLANGAKALAESINQNPDMLRNIVRPFAQILRMIGNIAEATGAMPKGITQQFVDSWNQEKMRLGKQKDDALDRNTAALDDLTALYQQGTHGGGDRARGALPSGLKGPAFQAAVAGRSLRLGAFAW